MRCWYLEKGWHELESPGDIKLARRHYVACPAMGLECVVNIPGAPPDMCLGTPGVGSQSSVCAFWAEARSTQLCGASLVRLRRALRKPVGVPTCRAGLRSNPPSKCEVDAVCVAGDAAEIAALRPPHRCCAFCRGRKWKARAILCATPRLWPQPPALSPAIRPVAARRDIPQSRARRGS